ncbi:MAG TPA: hypothetical protein VHF67_05100 [Gaiellaceae bacterium]|nr:hypothetical protein [Gaiellaceae bacterium]
MKRPSQLDAARSRRELAAAPLEDVRADEPELAERLRLEPVELEA